MCILPSLLYELTLVYPELLQKNNWTEPIPTVVKFHHTLVITTQYYSINLLNQWSQLTHRGSTEHDILNSSLEAQV